MPRPRRPENIDLPDRWSFEHGAYFYQVPRGLEMFWNFKRRYRLGATYDSALAEFQRKGSELQATADVGHMLVPAANIVRLPEIPRTGVYFLLRGPVIVYVGKSNALAARVASHYGGPMQFDGVRCQAAEGLVMDRLEQLYIARFAPEYNVCHMPKNEADEQIELRESAELRSVQKQDTVSP
jgi:hypothetical protein